MRLFQRNIFGLAMAAIAFSASAFSQQLQVQRTPFDVTSYQIDAQLGPLEDKLTATTDVTFVPLEDTRSVSFELNGSLKVESIVRMPAAGGSAPATTPAPAKGKPATAATPAPCPTAS